MARQRSFVPQNPTGSLLEMRIAPSTFGDIGNWFESQYNHVKQDLGITHKKSSNDANQLLKTNAQVGNPSPASSFIRLGSEPSTHIATMHSLKISNKG